MRKLSWKVILKKNAPRVSSHRKRKHFLQELSDSSLKYLNEENETNTTSMNITITSIKPFNSQNGQALAFTGNSPQGPIEGTIWGHAYQASIGVGSTIAIQEDGKNAKFGTYQGKQRLNVNAGASITILNGPQYAQNTPQSTEPVQQHQNTPQAQQPVTANPGGKGEQVLDRAAVLVSYFFQALQKEGFSVEQSLMIAGRAPEIVSLWWFGEKSA